LQAKTFIGEDKEPLNRKQAIGALKKENNAYCVMQFFASSVDPLQATIYIYSYTFWARSKYCRY